MRLKCLIAILCLTGTFLWAQETRGTISGVITEPPSARSTPAGVGCGFYGSAMAEILRAVTDFDGAMFHVRCCSRGDSVCQWSSREDGKKAA